MRKFFHSNLEAVAIAEADPPPFPWRPLRPIYRIIGDSEHHFWPIATSSVAVHGYVLPADLLETRLSEGAATLLKEALYIAPGRQLVRNTDRTFTVRTEMEVERDRRLTLRECLAEAIRAYNADDVITCQSLLDRACIVEPRPSLASALRIGFSHEFSDEWSTLVKSALDDDPPHFDFDALRASIDWQDLPEKSLREAWLAAAEQAIHISLEPPPLASLATIDREHIRWAGILLAVRRAHPGAFPLLAHLRHRDLAALGEGNPSIVTKLAETLVGLWGGGSTRDTLRAMEEFISPNEPISNRVRTQDLRQHSTLFACLEATLDDTKRTRAWRKTTTHLSVSPDPTLPPWECGEQAAYALREEWGLMNSDNIGSVIRLARHEIGLSVFPVSFNHEESDNCHIIDPRTPPAAYLDETLVHRPRRVRTVIAQAIGRHVLQRHAKGVYFSRITTDETATSDTQKSVNAFAQYFIAPRERVKALVPSSDLESVTGYTGAVRAIMRHFGLSLSASFSHVANCHSVPPKFHWRNEIQATIRSLPDPDEWHHDRIPTSEVPENTRIPPERADKFAVLLARSVALGILTRSQALSHIGDNSPEAANWFDEKIRAATDPIT